VTTSWRDETKREAARQDDKTTRGRHVERRRTQQPAGATRG
jgi:hypothetical protein